MFSPTPIAKARPNLAGLLYLGSGIGLAAVHLGRRPLGLAPPEGPLRRADLPWLAAVILAGGVVGPLLLMRGLSVTPASSAALLLNVEGLAPMAIAWLLFREQTDRRIVTGALLILAVAVFHDPVTPRLLGAAVLTGVGLWLHLVEHHEHEHTREEMVHEHVHVHDARHHHAYQPDDPPGEPHAHVHRHVHRDERLVRRHPHYPDLHHRHSHTA